MNIDFRFYLSLILRRTPVMAIFILVCAGLGVITALKLPETYSTQARLLVESAQISDDLVSSTVQATASEQLDIIEQRLMTRANLIDIANRVGVYENIRSMSPDDVVAGMSAQTRIRRTAGREQATLMTVSFEGRSGQVAQAVVNEYVTLILQANVNFRMSRAENTLEFFQDEVNRIGRELDQQSAAIVAFKTANANALPEDQSYRLNRQTLLQERLSRLEREQASGQKQRLDIVRIFETTGSVRDQDGRAQGRSPEEQQLLVAQVELDALRADYTDTNPRVVRAQDRVDRLKAVVVAQGGAATTGENAATTPEEAILDATLSEIDNRLADIALEIESTERELGELSTAITATSSNGIQLAALERTFEATQARYNNAVSNLNRAKLGERIETSAQGQRITVIENANVPSAPTGPNRTKIAAAGLAAGLGLAAAYFVLLEILNRTIRRPAEIQSRFGITPIAAIPYMESRREIATRRLGLLATTAIVMIAVPLALWYIDQAYLPLEIVVQKGLTRLGLG